ncbi:MAG: hypothetical protein MJZ12_11320 [Prevotella sp.]|nr:hypothetical protein [Prevotella sp.]
MIAKYLPAVLPVKAASGHPKGFGLDRQTAAGKSPQAKQGFPASAGTEALS